MGIENTAPVALISRTDDERLGTPLLVLLHGYGSNEEDLMSLARYLPEDFTYLSVRAPLSAGPGFSWFPLTSEIDYSVDAVQDAVRGLWELLEPLCAEHSSVALLGFSQGMAMATSLARHRPEAIDAVIGLSGFAVQMPEDGFFDDEALRARPLPMFWGRDTADPVITADKIAYTLQWVPEHTVLTSEQYQGIAHSVCAEEISDVASFLANHVLAQSEQG